MVKVSGAGAAPNGCLGCKPSLRLGRRTRWFFQRTPPKSIFHPGRGGRTERAIGRVLPGRTDPGDHICSAGGAGHAAWHSNIAARSDGPELAQVGANLLD